MNSIQIFFNPYFKSYIEKESRGNLVTGWMSEVKEEPWMAPGLKLL